MWAVLPEKFGERDQGQAIDDHTERVTLLATRSGVQHSAFAAACTDYQERMMSVAVEDKSGATRPKMPDGPEHSLSIEFIEAISGINTGSNKGV